MNIEAVIGLEIHAQLNTKTKMFCRCKNDSFDAIPNTNVCPVCMGFPGQLPVLNKEALNLAIKAGIAFNLEILDEFKMDRKNYFYPDNPRGFQISQYDKPLSKNGYISLISNEDNTEQVVRINRIHIEDDAGKLTHFNDFSLIDFNRAGVPLIEIVSEPDIRSSEQAVLYAKEIQKILKYLNISDADMEKGMFRFDASISVRESGDNKLNKRAEIKNLNSFKFLSLALDYEFNRQKELYLNGELLEKELTLGFDETSFKTFFLRDKEQSLDYRYFTEPDIPNISIASKEIFEQKKNISKLPADKKKEYLSLGMSEEEATFISSNNKFVIYFDKILKETGDLKLCLNFFNNILIQYLKENFLDISEQKIKSENMIELINLVKKGVISTTQAKNDVFPVMFEDGLSASEVISKKAISQISDTDFIEKICKEIINQNTESVDLIKSGKDRVLGYLVGLVMKETKGKANPSMVSAILMKLINS